MSRLVQSDVDAYFRSTARFWNEVYEQPTARGAVYLARQAVVLSSIDALDLPAGSPVLEVGCGSGRLAVELAARGFDVSAIDTVDEMLRQTDARAASRGLATRVRTALADVHALPFMDGSFAVVTALGVLPWVDSPPDVVAEMARVLRPGGHLVVTADNELALHRWLDPRLMPVLGPFRRRVKSLLRSVGLLPHKSAVPRARTHLAREVDRIVLRHGLSRIRSSTVGYGPFTFWRRAIFQGRDGARLHRRMQTLADQGFPLLGAIGVHYVLVAKKPTPPRATDRVVR